MTFYRLGLLGYPLEHSLSPSLHQVMLASLGLDGRYELFSIPPTQPSSLGLEPLLMGLRHGRLAGLNVTIPYKTGVLPYLDELSATAKTIGAVNAILVRRGKLLGENFDCLAFQEDLNHYLLQAGLPALARQPYRSAVVLGAGGAARAVLYALLGAGWRVEVAARRLEQAQLLVEVFQANQGLTIRRLDQLDCLSTYDIDLIVNTTPLGMFPHLAGSAWPANLTLPPTALVYDLVYNPPQTVLMSRARASGLIATNGLGMLVRQAAMSLEAWTGMRPDWRAVVRSISIEASAS